MGNSVALSTLPLLQQASSTSTSFDNETLTTGYLLSPHPLPLAITFLPYVSMIFSIRGNVHVGPIVFVSL